MYISVQAPVFNNVKLLSETNHICHQRRIKVSDCQASCGLDHIQYQLDGLISNYNALLFVIPDCLEVDLNAMQTTGG